MEIDGDTIILEIEYDSDEMLRPLLYRIKGRALYRRLIDTPQTMLPNFLGALTVLYFLDLMSVRSIIIAAGAAIFVSAFVSASLLDRLAALVAFTKRKYIDGRKDGHPGYRFVISPDGISKECHQKVDTSAWPQIESATETEQDILISHYDRTDYFFPKRIFQDFNELVYFKNFIRDRIGDRATF